jgi:hypothetical protein
VFVERGQPEEQGIPGQKGQETRLYASMALPFKMLQMFATEKLGHT